MDRETRIQEYLREPEMDRNLAESIVAQEDAESYLGQLYLLIHDEKASGFLPEIANDLNALVEKIESRAA